MGFFFTFLLFWDSKTVKYIQLEYRDIKNNIEAISSGLAQGNSMFAIEYDMGKVIGTGYFKNSNKLQNATKVRVIVKKTGAHDFVIRTAFPVK